MHHSEKHNDPHRNHHPLIMKLMCLLKIPWHDHNTLPHCTLIVHFSDCLMILHRSMTLAVLLWRFIRLVSDCWRCLVSDGGRCPRDLLWLVGHHFYLSVVDSSALLGLIILLLTAPHRFVSSSLWARLSENFNSLTSMPSTLGNVPRIPIDGSEIVAFHGTYMRRVEAIEHDGFRPSTSGMLGAGVYVSRDMRKVRWYGDGAILRLKISVGRVKTIDSLSDPSWATWSSEGFDTAWVPAAAGLPNVPSNREEGCVADPRRIRVLGRLLSHHLVAWLEVREGFKDWGMCGLWIFRFPLRASRYFRMNRAAREPLLPIHEGDMDANT